MDFVRVNAVITGSAPLSQSHQHQEPKLEGESNDAYDARTWRHKLNKETIGGKETVVIPAFAIHDGLKEAAKYSKRQIPGQGRSTWTQKFASGITVLSPVSLGIDPATVSSILISANVDGRRGSGKRVPRRFPQIPPGWEATFEALIIDPIITEDIFREALEGMGLYIGLGQFRPQNGGSNGRFMVKSIDWKDNRRPVSVKRAA